MSKIETPYIYAHLADVIQTAWLGFLAHLAKPVGWVFALKTFFIIISLILLAGIAILFFRIKERAQVSFVQGPEELPRPGPAPKAANRRWQSILNKLEKGDESNLKLAVIEADKILDDLLRRMGYAGQDIGERLKQISPAQIPQIDQLWQAHKLRNQIVHQPDFRLNLAQAKRAIEIYQKVFEDLKLL